jgi:hypothetical protein
MQGKASGTRHSSSSTTVQRCRKRLSPHLQAPALPAHCAHVPSHLEAREGAARRGAWASAAVLTVALGAVSHGTTLHAVALDGAWREQAASSSRGSEESQ